MTSLPIVNQSEPSGLRLALTLAAAGLVSGIALVTTYEITKPTIDANKRAAQRSAVFKVVPGATAMQFLKRAPGGVAVAEDAAEGLFGAYDDSGKLVGYAMRGAGAGFQDTITLMVGYDVDRGRVVGMEVLGSRETPGLGDKIYKDAAFVASFEDLVVEPEVVVVKDGSSAPNEIDAITGATISSKAVAKIVTQAVVSWKETLPASAQAPALVPKEDAGGAQ